MNNNVLKQLLLSSVLLLFSSLASAATIEINDGDLNVFDPLRIADYQVNLVVGGPKPDGWFTFGFKLPEPGVGFVLDINVPLGFLGTLWYCTSKGPDCSGLGFLSGGLVAGESTTLQIFPTGSASPENPTIKYMSFLAPDMPPLSSVPTTNPSAVPIPPAVWLFGSGLLGLVGFARRRKVAF